MATMVQITKFQINFTIDQVKRITELMSINAKYQNALMTEMLIVWRGIEDKSSFFKLIPAYSQFRRDIVYPAAYKSHSHQYIRNKFKSDIRDIEEGKISLPSFKARGALTMTSQSMGFAEEDGKVLTKVCLWADEEKNGRKSFAMVPLETRNIDGGRRALLDLILREGKKVLGASKIVYNQRKDKFMFQVAYHAPCAKKKETGAVMGVDLGAWQLVYAAIPGDFPRWHAGQNAQYILDKQAQFHARRKKFQHRTRKNLTPYRGHGRKNLSRKIRALRGNLTNFKDTENHRISKDLIEFALKNQVATIVMEDLSKIRRLSYKGAGKETNQQYYLRRLLESWTYYDLQQKITYKAQRQGIKVVKIYPAYTSLQCSECGKANKANRRRDDLRQFVCVNCGYIAQADYNASLNIALRHIHKNWYDRAVHTIKEDGRSLTLDFYK